MIGLYIALPLLIVLILIGIPVVRALRFRPEKGETYPDLFVECDEEKAVSDLAEMIRCKTVSDTDESKEDDAEFEKFEKLLPRLFPNVHAACTFTKLGKRSLLFHWKGKDSSVCRVLMAHYDVVSVEPSLWQKPAFEGIL